MALREILGSAAPSFRTTRAAQHMFLQHKRQNLVIETSLCVFCSFILEKCREKKGKKSKMLRKRFRLPDFALQRGTHRLIQEAPHFVTAVANGFHRN